jgi:D-aminopeptidase
MGSSKTNGSGDYVIAFSTAKAFRRTPERRSRVSTIPNLPNDLVLPLFQAVIEATEAVIYNSLLMATTTHSVQQGKARTIHKLPIKKLAELLKRLVQ